MTAIGPATQFDPTADLPTGLTVLEASAGTGKTYALTSLAVRYVAELDVPASGLCIVSFTEAATAELRGRVRSRLVGAAHHLEQVLAGSDTPVGEAIDPVDATIADTDETGRRERLTRLRTAIAEFDAAMITTIHGFCGRVLAAAGAASAERSIDTGDLEVDEVVNDLFLTRFGHLPDTLVDPGRIATAVRVHLGMPDSELHLPDPPTKKPTAGQALYLRDADAARQLVADAAREIRRRREQRRRRTFDSLLADTRALLTGPEGATTAAALRERLRVVLIDEFQDTDRVQWDIFRTAFVDSPTTAVVLVGDPKQSIYRFRSAELSAYLDAVAVADRRATLATNWRSDGTLLRGLETLFVSSDDEPAHFGSDEVRFAPVGHAPRREGPAVRGDDHASVMVRQVPGRSGVPLSAPTARRLISGDLVRTVEHLLRSGLTIAEPLDTDASDSADAPDVRERPVTARDIAVLTRSNADAASFAARLAAAGIPAATSSSNSVLETEAAEQWRRLLLALERPGSPGRVRAAAIGWFVGHRLDEVATFDEAGLDAVHDLVRAWADELHRGGVAALMAAVRSAGLDARILADPRGERHVTDLDHIAELLVGVSAGRRAGPSELLDHLRALADAATGGPAADLLARRIDRDDDAVQLLTIHKAKGLEFPIVLCPTLWTGTTDRGIPHAHVDGRRRLDVSWAAGASDWAWVKPLRGASRAEVRGEARRLLYVALTRARHRLYLWWPAVKSDPDSVPLADLLARATGADEVPTTASALQPLVDRSEGALGVVEVTQVAGRDAADEPDEPDEPDVPDEPHLPGLEVAEVERRLDRRWRIWSFTSVTSVGASAPHQAISERPITAEHSAAAEQPVMGGVDEPSVDDPASPTVSSTDTTTSADGAAGVGRLRPLVGGVEFGTLVHEIMEHTDFASSDLDAELLERCSELLRHRSLRVDPAELAAGLAEAVRCPLGGPVGPRALSDIARRDRLDELEFHVPLGSIRAGDIGRVLATHLAPDDPFRPWAASLADGGGGIEPGLDIGGRLTGSIDLVWRADGSVHAADYKTNQLGVDHPYDRTGLVAAMVHHHYPLQAILYLVALHRYLRWRLPAYVPTDHLGGAAYLFVRGMHAAPGGPRHDSPPGVPDVPDVPGVLWWHPGPAAITAVDRLLAGATT